MFFKPGNIHLSSSKPWVCRVEMIYLGDELDMVPVDAMITFCAPSSFNSADFILCLGWGLICLSFYLNISVPSLAFWFLSVPAPQRRFISFSDRLLLFVIQPLLVCWKSCLLVAYWHGLASVLHKLWVPISQQCGFLRILLLLQQRLLIVSLWIFY